MEVTVNITKSFNSAAKPLLKKNHSLSEELLHLEENLILKPRLGTSLGQDVYKIRLKISSKGKGKSGGARVISFVETVLVKVTEPFPNEETVVNLIMIYDKADVDNISNKELNEFIKNFKAK